MMNHVTLMGRLTRDPELRRTQSGTAVVSFTVAVDRDFADKNTGDRPTDFLDVVAWRGTAEFVSRYFVKGQMAAVEGRIQVRSWQDKDGSRRRATEIVAENVYFAGPRPAARDGQKAEAAPEYSDADCPPEPDDAGYDDQELPY